MKVNKVKTGKIFIYQGKKYQWKEISEAWRKLCDENGDIIQPQQIPMDVLLNKADVEVQDDKD